MPVTVRSSLQVSVGNLSYQSQPSGYDADISIANGPSPGVVLASSDGTIITFSELSRPGYCKIQNLSVSSYLDYGIYDTVTTVFYPLFELEPGQFHVVKFSRNMSYTFGDTTGTGTGAGDNRFMVKGQTDDCRVLIECFDAAEE